MNPSQQNPQPTDPNQPVAYDKDGRPLYAHPPTQTAAPVPAPIPHVVQMTRSADPQMPHISDEIRAKHDASLVKYPFLNLSEGEYVINAVRRHPIGLVSILGVTGVMVLAIIGAMALYPSFAAQSMVNLPSFGSFVLPAILLLVLVLLGGYIAAHVYLSNKFFLTNESVIQEIQTSLLARHEQTVSLANIEDASFRQSGLLQTIFDYGSIRLSTEGEETTYRFHYVSNPKRQIAILNNAVESFKNGRPVTGE